MKMRMTRRIGAWCWVAALIPAAAGAQPATAGGERLSLENAVRMAIDSNRQLQSARLQLDKAKADVKVARSRRLPVFETQLTGSQLLTPVEFAFSQGAFGNYPATGPIPSADTTVTVPRQPTMYIASQVSQPISQQFRIGLGIDNAAASLDIERERLRAQEQSVANSVKRVYFAILQTASALAATDEAIALYRELDRTLEVRVAQRVALRSDALDVQLRLAREELTRTTWVNALASQKEQLNQLLGRDLGTDFTADDIGAASLVDVDLEAARSSGLQTRPDLREARLKVTQADLDRRLTKAGRIPDVSVAASYISNFNMNMMPTNLTTVGIQLKWEPFDWGRRGQELAAKASTVQQARLAVRDAEDRAVMEINSRFRTLAEKRALLAVARMSQSSAREKLRVKTNQYQLQAALLPDVLQVRAELAGANDSYQQALLGFWTAKADYDLAAGEDVRR